MIPTDAVLLLNKPPGVTSFASLYPVKRTLGKKVGHAGTLDKFAQGLMIVLTGAFTRLNPLFSSMDKRYVATIQFGLETSTLDPEGEIICEKAPCDLPAIEQALKTSFIGTIMQKPPAYSALHIDGKRAHTLARSGRYVEIPSRPVTIFSTNIITWNSPYLELEIHCSKGTYIRSLARDIALACQSCGHLRALKRTAIGPYSLDEAISSDQTNALVSMASESLGRLLQIENFGLLEVSGQTALRLGYGQLPQEHNLRMLRAGEKYAGIVDDKGKLLAVVTLDNVGRPMKFVAMPKYGVI